MKGKKNTRKVHPSSAVHSIKELGVDVQNHMKLSIGIDWNLGSTNFFLSKANS
jgi:hypothetical protein